MKKILALCLMIALAFGAGGATCKNFWASAEKEICNPPPAVVDAAKLAAPVIKIAIGMLIVGSAEYLAAIDSAAAIDSILRTGCLGATALNKLITFLQSSVFKLAEIETQTKAMARMKAAPKAVNVEPFIDWSKTQR